MGLHALVVLAAKGGTYTNFFMIRRRWARARCARTFTFEIDQLVILRDFSHRKPLDIEQGQDETVFGAQTRQQLQSQIAGNQRAFNVAASGAKLGGKIMRLGFSEVAQRLFLSGVAGVAIDRNRR